MNTDMSDRDRPTKLSRADARPPYQQLAGLLRDEIQRGTYAPGSKLPSGPSLAEEYGVAKMTVQQAMRLLKDEGLVVGQQGSGVFVLDRRESLANALSRAFLGRRTSISLFGFPSRALVEQLTTLLKRAADEDQPHSIRLNLLVQNLHLWNSWQDDRSAWTESLSEVVAAADRKDLIDADFEVREFPLAQYVFLCLVNDERAFMEWLEPSDDPESGDDDFGELLDYPSIELRYADARRARDWYDAAWRMRGIGAGETAGLPEQLSRRYPNHPKSS